MKKRILALVLALTLALGLLPATALAAEQEITIRLSVFNQGVPTQDKEGNAMLARSVVVTDRNGDGAYSLDEALLAAHEAYAPNGGADYQSGYNNDWGTYAVTKLWGEDSSAVSFYKDHVYTGAVDAEMLSEGQLVDAFIYKDQSNWTDRYCYFTQNGAPVDALSVCVGEEFALTLLYDQWGAVSPQPTAPLGVFDQSGAYSECEALRGEQIIEGIYQKKPATDQKGEVKISFTAQGTYLLTAQYDSTNYTDYNNTPPQYYLVPPLCTVTVYDDTPQGHVDAALDNLTESTLLGGNASLDALSQNLTLPASTYGDTAITWSLDTQDDSVIGYYGDNTVYIGGAKSAAVTAILTATVASTEDSGVQATKTFALTVPAAASDPDKTGVVDYGKVMSGIAAKWQDGFTATSPIDDTDLPWAVVDMAAYGAALDNAEQSRYETLLSGTDSYGTPNSSLAKFILAQQARKEATAAPAVPASPDIWSAPSILLARYGAGTTALADNQALVSCMTSYLSGTGLDVDTAAAMLPALAPYYNSDTAVKTAVDKTVTWLSAQQGAGGTWRNNANSTAQVVVGLAALGIDAHTDTRFVKSGKSAVEGLLSFALADGTGFGYGGNVTYNNMATEQGFRALVAYARMKEGGKAYNLYLQAKDSTGVVTAPNITATNPGGGEGGGTITPSTITVSFSLRGDTVHGEGGHTAYTTWVSSTGYTLPSGATVADLLAAAAGDKGFTYAGSSYVSSITWNGITLSEQANGPYSGWMFTVNGKITNTGMTTTVLHSGDSVVWRYVDNYNTEIDWSEDGTGTPSTGGQTKPEEKPEEKPGETEITYTDVPQNSWCAEAVAAVTKAGLFTGYADGSFGVHDSITRGQMALVLYRLAGQPETTNTSAFSDEADWCATALTWAAESGVALGYGDGSFGVGQLLKREQLVTFLYRYALQAKLDTSASADLSAYTDRGEVLDADAMAWAVGAGLMKGRTETTLAPDAAITRAEAAVIFQRFLTAYPQK